MPSGATPLLPADRRGGVPEPEVIPGARTAFLVAGFNSLPGSLAGLDAQCQSDATAAGLSGTYKALVATDGASAASRFSTSGGPWVRVDGAILSETAADLFGTEPLLAAIDAEAEGGYCGNCRVANGADGLTTPGTAATTCNNWTSTSGSDFVVVSNSGTIARIGQGPTAFDGGGGSAQCSGTIFRWYCLEE